MKHLESFNHSQQLEKNSLASGNTTVYNGSHARSNFQFNDHNTIKESKLESDDIRNPLVNKQKYNMRI